GIEFQMRHVLDFDCGENSAILVDNNDWMSKFSYTEFLRDVGKNFPVNVMLGKDSVKSRLTSEAGLSYTEFSYMLLQAYDFVHLNREHGCELQIGGSDQWGNVTAGIDLGRRMLGAQLYGMTCPLLTKADGTKMGKTESGAVWLSAERTSPYQFYQYWLNVADEDTSRCLRFLTELSQEEIMALEESRASAPQERACQKKLAEEITRMIHGEAGLETARQATEMFFVVLSGGEITGLSDADLDEVFSDVPNCEIAMSELDGDGFGLIDALSMAGLAASNGKARQAITQGSIYINNVKQTDLKYRLTKDNLASESVIVLRSGKKRYALLRLR
ncbi:MAG: tyrosyl-tRNA synthetase, partial [Mariniblastus sp.]